MRKFQRVAVGVSGGVDSAIAALLLKTKGYNVEGIFMKNWDIIDETGTCTADNDYNDAQYVCDKLNIKLHYVNFVKVYWNDVFCNLIKEYGDGHTPNVDVLCNRYVKFNHFYRYAVENLKMDAIATGHYAQTSFGSYLENFNENRNTKLLKSTDVVKDQTLFLSQINQDALCKTMFPLAGMTKKEVKEMAIQNGLEKIAGRKESMGICFIGSRNFQGFISEYVEDKPGKFVDIDTGKVVGTHRGVHYWTLGQRSRLHSCPNPYYIAKKDVKENIIYLAMGNKHPLLYSDMFFTSKPHWICEKPKELVENNILNCKFKFQHTHDEADCELCETSKGLIIRLFKAKRAITDGQYAVFYVEDECLGSAKITHVISNNYIYYLLRNKRKFDIYKDPDLDKIKIKLSI